MDGSQYVILSERIQTQAHMGIYVLVCVCMCVLEMANASLVSESKLMVKFREGG